MTKSARTRNSKFLAYVLRHKPEDIGITLDDGGWVDIDVLLTACAAHGKPMSHELLEDIVATSDKRRFAISDDGRRIRANQGHSLAVDLGYEPSRPPDRLYHGTVDRVLDAIRRDGLSKMQRHHVHLSADTQTATAVGGRRGRPVILVVRAAAMVDAGHHFFVSDNGVWLTDHVPAEFIDFPDS